MSLVSGGLIALGTAVIGVVGIILKRKFRPVKEKRDEDRYELEKEIGQFIKESKRDRIRRLKGYQ